MFVRGETSMFERADQINKTDDIKNMLEDKEKKDKMQKMME